MATGWIWLLVGVVATADVLFPLGYAVPLLYIPLVTLTLRLKDRDRAPMVALVTSLLTVGELAISHRGDLLTQGLVNRALTVMALWITAAGVSQFRRLEAFARRHEADAELGRMTTVMAHELRNPLAGVTAALQVIHPRLRDTPHAPIVGEALTRLARVSDLVESLLQYARPVTVSPVAVRVTDVFGDVITTTAEDPRYATLTIAPSHSDDVVLADRAVLVAVLLGLVANAAHPDAGATRIALESRFVEEQCELRVVDNGRGVPEDSRARLGQPFVTGRADRPGLGLAIARRRVDALGGTLRHEHPAGGGTIAIVQLTRAPI